MTAKNKSASINLSVTMEKFGAMGEKTGWTYISIPAAKAQLLKPGNKQSFRVKGVIDDYGIQKTAMIPMGDGDFIIPINATMRKALKKQKGATVKVKLEVDNAPILPPSELMECLADEPEALTYFNGLPQSHRNYFTKWIDSAKTEPTKAKRIALVIKTMIRKMDFGAMLREEREERRMLGK